MPDPAAPDWGSDPSSSRYREAGRAGPLDADVAVGLLQRGQTLADQGDWDIAAGTFSRVVGSPDPAVHTAALLGLAECRYRLDDEPAAIQAWISATQAPENPLTWRAWKALAAARVRAGDMAAAARAYREAARRAPQSEQAELQSRIGWLSRELGDGRASERAFSRSRTAGAQQPSVTYGLLAVTVATSLLTLLGGQREIESLLLLDKFAILFGGEYWRLLTVVLVHGSLIHLMFNMYALWTIGPIVEALYGSWRYLAIYALCAVAGSAASYATSPNPAVGASGAVFGLFGALLVADRVHKPALTRNARNLTMQIGILIGINLVIGFSIPGIDNAAHVGGLLAGAWLGFVLVPIGARLDTFWSRPSPSTIGSGSTSSTAGSAIDRARLLSLAGVALLVALIVLLVAIGPVTWHPRDLFGAVREPGAAAEPIGDAVGVATGEPGGLGLQDRRRPGTSRDGAGRQRGILTLARTRPGLQGYGTPGYALGALVAERQAPPDGHAVATMEAAIDGQSAGRVGASEGVGA
jgi:membrane associated rhomboid family serine protease